MKKVIKLAVMASTLITSVAFSQCADISAAGVWDLVKTGANPVVSGTAGAMSGVCAMAVPVENGKRYVQDDMSAETSFRGTFQVDPNSSVFPTSGSDRKVKIHNAGCIAGCSAFGSTDWFQVKLRQNPGQYKLGIWARAADGTKHSITVNIPDSCSTVEYQLIAGNPGTFRLWVNNTTEASPDFEITTADFTGRFADTVRLGRMGTGNNIAAGNTFYMDTFESRRQTFIGNSCAP